MKDVEELASTVKHSMQKERDLSPMEKEQDLNTMEREQRSQEQIQLEAALAEDDFGLQSAIGKRSQRFLKDSAEQHKAYKVDRSFKAKKEFRMKWQARGSHNLRRRGRRGSSVMPRWTRKKEHVSLWQEYVSCRATPLILSEQLHAPPSM